MTAETDIADLDDGGSNTAAEFRTAATSVLTRADSGTIKSTMERVDTAPSSPDALDDEFDDESVTGWSELNIGSTTYDEANGTLTFSNDENVNQLRGLYKAAPSSQDFTIMAKLDRVRDDTTYTAHFIFVAESTSGVAYRMGGHSPNYASALQHATPTSSLATWGSEESIYANHVYVRLAWDNTGGTLTAQYSLDGVSWSRDLGAAVAGGWTPGIVGIGCTNRSSDPREFTFEFFRRTA